MGQLVKGRVLFPFATKKLIRDGQLNELLFWEL